MVSLAFLHSNEVFVVVPLSMCFQSDVSAAGVSHTILNRGNADNFAK